MGGRFLGVSSARRIASASRSHARASRNALARLIRETPPKLYVFGGTDSEQQLAATAECFDLGFLRWEPLPPMATARSEAAAAPLPSSGGQLCIVGGSSASVQTLSAAEAFDPASGRWSSLPPMPTARSQCTVVAMDGVVYVVGG